MEICVLCGKEFEGYGNNPEPLAEGSCCDECDCLKVIPERIMKLGFPPEAAYEIGKSSLKMRVNSPDIS